MDNMDNLRSVIRQATKAAGSVLLSKQQQSRIVEKDRGSFVTDADHISDQIIIARLAEHYPNIPFLTEESGGEQVKEGPLFVVDALDGTSNFYCRENGNFWAVSVAYVADGQSRVGVVYQPNANVLFESDGQHAIQLSKSGYVKQLYVSNEDRLDYSCVWTDWVKGENEKAVEILQRLKKFAVLPQMRACCTMSAMQVALGHIEGYVHPGPQPEDVAAAALIVEGAGGTVTDIEGESWSLFSELPIVMSNGRVHDKLLEVLKS